MTMTLSRRVPARTKTLTATWCRKDFAENNETFRGIRRNASDRMDTCFWCKCKFADGEMMALACVKGKGNKVLCQKCADELLASDERGRQS